MLSSPYPVPVLRIWNVAMGAAYAAGAAAGTWVIVSPPRSYDGIGIVLTYVWGCMLVVGFGAALIAVALRRHQVELPALILGTGGIAIYDYLSWQQVFTVAPGSGPRALLLIMLAGFVVARVALLLHIDREARRRKLQGEGIG